MRRKTVQAAWKRTLAVVAGALVFVSGAQAADQYRVLHYFSDKPAFSPLAGLVADSAGNLYGTSESSADKCSDTGCGVVFKLTRESGGKWGFRIIHRFNGNDGAAPVGSLLFDSYGNLYGTTSSGGVYNLGTVFELSPAGQKWNERVLYSFGGSSTALILPDGALTWDMKGNLYGTTPQTERGGYGGVFQLKRSGNGWKETVIHAFDTSYDGQGPSGPLAWDSSGNVYGTTIAGGLYSNGVVYELKPSSHGKWTETVLYNFTGGVLGANPVGGLVFDTVGNLYGATASGGVYTCGPLSCGTVFQLKPSRGHWILSILHSFNGTDGDAPPAGVIIDSAGDLYGTTTLGGQDGDGVVFELSHSGRRWTETLLRSFHGKDGSEPYSGLILDHETLYGTTSFGGKPSGAYGVVYSVKP